MMFKTKTKEQKQAEELAARIAQIEANYGMQLAKVRADQQAIRGEIERLETLPPPGDVVEAVHYTLNREQTLQAMKNKLRSLEIQCRALRKTKDHQVQTLQKQAKRLTS